MLHRRQSPNIEARFPKVIDLPEEEERVTERAIWRAAGIFDIKGTIYGHVHKSRKDLRLQIDLESRDRGLIELFVAAFQGRVGTRVIRRQVFYRWHVQAKDEVLPFLQAIIPALSDWQTARAVLAKEFFSLTHTYDPARREKQLAILVKLAALNRAERPTSQFT